MRATVIGKESLKTQINQPVNDDTSARFKTAIAQKA
jgi:hypothetical protein